MTVVLPAAPPVIRGAAEPPSRRRLPALVLLVVGAALVIGPVVGGLFTKVASGQQMIDSFEPHLQLDALDQYDADLRSVRSGAAALNTVYADRQVPAGRYPGLDTFHARSAAIDARATALLSRIRAAEPDYREVSSIGGFDRVPFLLVAAGIALAWAGGSLLAGRRRRAGGAVVLALAAATALVAYPLLVDLPRGTRAGDRLRDALAPVMTSATVRTEQRDFVVLVHAVGELDTAFRGVPTGAAQRRDLAALDAAWPQVSSDLAGLVGAINDNLADYEAFDELGGGLQAMPWVLIAIGGACAAAALASWPRTRKGRP